VWSKCYEWVGLASTDHWEPKKNTFLNFKMTRVNEVVNQIWGCMWITIVGKLWRHRNHKTFKNGRIDHIEIFTMSQLKVWLWFSSKVQLASFFYSDWCLEPLVCMKSIKKYLVGSGRIGLLFGLETLFYVLLFLKPWIDLLVQGLRYP